VTVRLFVLGALLAGCLGRVPAEDGRPVFLNVVPPRLDERIVDALPRAAAYWELCGIRFALERAPAAHMIDVEVVERLPGHIAGDWYTDGLWTRVRLASAELRNLDDVALRTAIAHELGHAFGLDHVEGEAVMAAPLQVHASLQVPDVVAFRALTGRACIAPVPPAPKQTDRRENSF
jgi:Zn-dependent protease with chaperone function